MAHWILVIVLTILIAPWIGAMGIAIVALIFPSDIGMVLAGGAGVAITAAAIHDRLEREGM